MTEATNKADDENMSADAEHENIGETPTAEDVDMDAALGGVEQALNEAELSAAEPGLEQELADTKDKLLRTMAEMENLRRRSQRDKEDAHNYAITKFARDMLEVSDNLQRALDSIPAASRENEDVKLVVQGVEMTENELVNALERYKITRVEAHGKKFDPHKHQAMFEIEDMSVEPGTVLQVVQHGYLIADRLLRPSMVGVAKGGKKKEDIKVDQSA